VGRAVWEFREFNMTEQRTPFASLGYRPVGPIVNRLLARYLRTQRKNMRRFFQERGLYVLTDRMNQIRKSRQGMMAKNRYFQQVLNDYSKLVNPTVAPAVPGSVLQPAPVIAGETEPADQ
jgi:hypothetical protein